MSYGDITRQNVQTNISFLLHVHNFLSLSNVCKPILSNVSGSCLQLCLYQGKAASNVKHASVHVSLMYTCSVNELVKLLLVNLSVP